ncbi:MAG: PHP domain-containing protein [Succinatimonas hippei]|nr:PHP domain-containing protein [Succinatimonas hippei]
MTVFISKIDLHSHSTASDGALSPTELVERALSRDLKILALSDHDTTGGIDEALLAARGTTLTLVPGCEISTTWLNRQIHIVGLFLNYKTPAFVSFLEQQRQKRLERAQAIGRKLERQGFHDAYERCKARARDGANITRGNYARFIFEEGKAQSIDDAFNSYLKKGRSCYVSTHWVDIKEAVDAIHAADGVAVLAHPRRYDLTNTKLRELTAYFKACGGEAMEVASCQQRPCDRVFLADLAAEKGLMASQGSDFHQASPWRDLGHYLILPEGVKPVWECDRALEYLGTDSASK